MPTVALIWYPSVTPPSTPPNLTSPWHVTIDVYTGVDESHAWQAVDEILKRQSSLVFEAFFTGQDIARLRTRAAFITARRGPGQASFLKLNDDESCTGQLGKHKLTALVSCHAVQELRAQLERSVLVGMRDPDTMKKGRYIPHMTLGSMDDLKHLVGQRVEGGKLELKVVGGTRIDTPWPVKSPHAAAPSAKRQRIDGSLANDPPTVKKLMVARDNALAELEGQLVGVEPVKRQIRMLCETAIATERRELLGIERRPVGNHMLFIGNPGTGKSTVAEIVARLLHSIGAVPTAKLSIHENARSALCGTTLGSTAHQTKEVLLSAMCTGLKWENVGPTPPGKPEEDQLDCPDLAKELARRKASQVQFEPADWDKFNITALRSTHFILVNKTKVLSEYYRPVQEGGTLMLDEAYSLLPMKGGEDYSTEAITQLVALADKLRGKLAIILAGYWEQPNNRDIKHLLRENSGLDSRFPLHNRIDFPDYKPPELLKIAKNMMDWHENKLDEKDDGAARRALSEKLSVPLPGNARDVRSILEAAMRKRDLRIAAIDGPTRDDLTILKAEDFAEEKQPSVY